MSTAEHGGLVQRMIRARRHTAEARARRSSPAMSPDAEPVARPVRGAAATQGWLPDVAGEDLVLMPGQLHLGTRAASVRTLLGSCVAVTLWHARHRIGGMCHFLLPTRGRRKPDVPDGRYGDEALETLVRSIRDAGCDPRQFEAHLYGGADTMPDGVGKKFNIGERNIEQAWHLIDLHGFQLQGVDVGEDIPRSVVLTLATGEVVMRRCDGPASAAAHGATRAGSVRSRC